MTSSRRPLVRWRLILAGGAALGFALAFWIRSFLLIGVYIIQDSMLPTLQQGDMVLVYQRAYRRHPPQFGDIVVFPYPRGTEEEKDLVVKRVVGLPGDVIRITPKGLWRNGAPLAEWYVEEPNMAPPYQTFVVPEGHVFLMGDNRNWSEDSRDYGSVPISQLLGRVVAIYWPLERFRFFKREPVYPRPLLPQPFPE